MRNEIPQLCPWLLNPDCFELVLLYPEQSTKTSTVLCWRRRFVEARKSNQWSDTERGNAGSEEGEEKWGKEKTSASPGEMHREVIQIERRCLIWQWFADTLNLLQFVRKVKVGRAECVREWLSHVGSHKPPQLTSDLHLCLTLCMSS